MVSMAKKKNPLREKELKKMKKFIEHNMRLGASKAYAEGYQQGLKDGKKQCRR